MPTITSLDGTEIFHQSLSSSYTYVISGTIKAGAEVLTEYIVIANSDTNLTNESTWLGSTTDSIIYKGQGQWGVTDNLIYTPVQSQLFSIAVTLDVDRLSEVSLFIRQQSVKDDHPNTYRDNSVKIISVNNIVYGKIETWSTGDVN
ncbi:MAG: hypothetical protein RLZZ561_1574, partial [Pseudomonadota bacterium]